MKGIYCTNLFISLSSIIRQSTQREEAEAEFDDVSPKKRKAEDITPAAGGDGEDEDGAESQSETTEIETDGAQDSNDTAADDKDEEDNEQEEPAVTITAAKKVTKAHDPAKIEAAGKLLFGAIPRSYCARKSRRPHACLIGGCSRGELVHSAIVCGCRAKQRRLTWRENTTRYYNGFLQFHGNLMRVQNGSVDVGTGL